MKFTDTNIFMIMKKMIAMLIVVVRPTADALNISSESRNVNLENTQKTNIYSF